MHAMTFIEVDICHGMASLRMLYFMTLIYIFKVNIVKCQYLSMVLPVKMTILLIFVTNRLSLIT